MITPKIVQQFANKIQAIYSSTPNIPPTIYSTTQPNQNQSTPLSPHIHTYNYPAQSNNLALYAQDTHKDDALEKQRKAFYATRSEIGLEKESSEKNNDHQPSTHIQSTDWKDGSSYYLSEFDQQAEYFYQQYYNPTKPTTHQKKQEVNQQIVPDYKSRVPESYLRKMKLDKKNLGFNYPPEKDMDFPKSTTVMNDGRQYNDQFRRNLTAKILSETKNKDENQINQTIRGISHQIKVYAYQIKVWLTAYQIIFIIESEQQNRKYMESTILKRISELFLSYFQQNKSEKRYRLVKILILTFKNFHLPESRVSSWINKIIYENRRILHGVDFSQYGFDPSDLSFYGTSFSNPQDNSNFDSNQLNPFPKKQAINRKIIKKQEAESVAYPVNFKENVALRIDQALKNSFQNVITQKASQFCLNEAIVRIFHEQYGKYTFIQKDDIARLSSQAMNKIKYSPSKSRNQNLNSKNNEELLKKLEARLNYFIKSNRDCQVSVLEMQSDTAMQQFGFCERLKQHVRNSWFASFIRKHNIRIPQRQRKPSKQLIIQKQPLLGESRSKMALSKAEHKNN